MQPVSVNILGCCMTRDVFNIASPVQYSIKAFVQRQNPFLMFQKAPVSVTRERFDRYYLDMLESRPDCPLTNRMYHNFNRRSMLTLINGSGPAKLLDNKGDWIVLDTHYVQSPDMWLLESGGDSRTFQASYACYLDTVIDLIDTYEGYRLERLIANANMTLLADRLCGFLSKHWGDRVILIDSRPADVRRTAEGDVPIYSEPSFRDASSHMCKLLSERIPLHLIALPEGLACRDGNPVHYTRDELERIRSRVDQFITDST